MSGFGGVLSQRSTCDSVGYTTLQFATIDCSGPVVSIFGNATGCEAGRAPDSGVGTPPASIFSCNAAAAAPAGAAATPVAVLALAASTGALGAAALALGVAACLMRGQLRRLNLPLWGSAAAPRATTAWASATDAPVVVVPNVAGK